MQSHIRALAPCFKRLSPRCRRCIFRMDPRAVRASASGLGLGFMGWLVRLRGWRRRFLGLGPCCHALEIGRAVRYLEGLAGDLGAQYAFCGRHEIRVLTCRVVVAVRNSTQACALIDLAWIVVRLVVKLAKPCEAKHHIQRIQGQGFVLGPRGKSS